MTKLLLALVVSTFALAGIAQTPTTTPPATSKPIAETAAPKSTGGAAVTKAGAEAPKAAATTSTTTSTTASKKADAKASKKSKKKPKKKPAETQPAN
jgi:hypothetical protein